MISVLVVGAGSSTEGLAPGDSSTEVLHARDLEEALEKLARNRRIDSVLLLDVADAAALVEAIREDNPAPPPIFAAEASAPPAGVQTLPAKDPATLLELVLAAITG